MELRSAASTSMDGFKANSGLIDQKSVALINSLFKVSTSHLDPVSGEKSMKFLSEKLLTTRPVLNRSRPSASVSYTHLTLPTNREV